MSIFNILNEAKQHPEVTAQQHTTLLQAATEMFGHSAGISTIVNNAESQDLGRIVSSWIGDGANRSISADQVQQVVGQDRINQLASSAGISTGVATAALARILPVLVDKLTPNGRLPQAA